MVPRAQTEFFDFTAKMTRYYGKPDIDRDIITFFHLKSIFSKSPGKLVPKNGT